MLKPKVLHKIIMLSKTASLSACLGFFFFPNMLTVFSNTLLLQIEKVIGTNLVLVYDLQNFAYFSKIAKDINQHKMHSVCIQ